ncbi:MAG: PilZ domain-containing protein [Acidobacteriia bacterium]|nr:PilZ domain-containing protein [Terriglobia bacterium]
MEVEDRRAESRPRYVGLLTLVAPGIEPISATIRNLSSSGICLETAVALEPGTLLCLDGPGFLAQGVVSYCKRHGIRYRVGVAMQPLEAA